VVNWLLAQPVLIGTAVIQYLLLRSPIATLRRSGARRWVITYYRLAPLALWATELLALAQPGFGFLFALQVASVVAVIVSAPAVVRLTGGPNPLAAFALDVLGIQAMALRARSAPNPLREELKRDIHRALDALDTQAFSNSTNDYARAFRIVILGYLDEASLAATRDALARTRSLEGGFYRDLQAQGAAGPLLRWAMPMSDRSQGSNSGPA
jgi:hypothetical protein